MAVPVTDYIWSLLESPRNPYSLRILLIETDKSTHDFGAKSDLKNRSIDSYFLILLYGNPYKIHAE